MISRSPKYDCMSAGKLPLAIRGAVAVHAARAPWPLQDLGDMIQGQLKASEGIDVSTIVDLFSDNARRISTGFEPLPEGFPPGVTCKCKAPTLLRFGYDPSTPSLQQGCFVHTLSWMFSLLSAACHLCASSPVLPSVPVRVLVSVFLREVCRSPG